MSDLVQRTISHAGFGPGRGPSHVRRFFAWLLATLDRQRQRGALSELDDRLLRDIGVSREAARRESERPFWQ